MQPCIQQQFEQHYNVTQTQHDPLVSWYTLWVLMAPIIFLPTVLHPCDSRPCSTCTNFLNAVYKLSVSKYTFHQVNRHTETVILAIIILCVYRLPVSNAATTLVCYAHNIHVYIYTPGSSLIFPAPSFNMMPSSVYRVPVCELHLTFELYFVTFHIQLSHLG